MIVSSAGIIAQPDDLVTKAKERCFTNYGEMFSAKNMALFAEDEYSSHFDIVLQSTSMKGLSYQFKQYFDNDYLILVPYPFAVPVSYIRIRESKIHFE